MKTDLGKHKLRIAKKAEADIREILTNFQSGDFASLGTLCNAVNVLDEFYQENSESDIAKRVPRLTQYLNGKFRECVVLVLKKDDKHYGYTAHNTTKFVRGESVHGASENRDEERKVLHDYVFEKDTSIECEFQVSWNWIVGPNLRSSTGNLDTGSAFVHSIVTNNNKREVSQIESTILAIAFEFWQANANSEPKESPKIFIKFNPQLYSSSWGQKLANRVTESLVQFNNLKPHDEE